MTPVSMVTYEILRHNNTFRKAELERRKVKPIVIITGTTNSGTSMVTKLLLDNGAFTGDWKTYKGNKLQEERAPYEKYEDEVFTSCAKRIMGESVEGSKKEPRKELADYWKKMPKDKTIVQKFPSAVFCLNVLPTLTDRPLKAVYCMRNINEYLWSYAQKTGLDVGQGLSYFSQSQAAIGLYRGSVHFCQFERLLERQDVNELLSYCEVDSEHQDLRAIQPELVHFKKMPQRVV